jgi:hypothetical protein
MVNKWYIYNMEMDIKEAREIFGEDVVETVITLVEVSDVDGVYSTFLDMGMDEHAECVEFLYFD